MTAEICVLKDKIHDDQYSLCVTAKAIDSRASSKKTHPIAAIVCVCLERQFTFFRIPM